MPLFSTRSRSFFILLILSSLLTCTIATPRANMSLRLTTSGVCDPADDSTCRSGLVCARRRGRQQCVTPLSSGKPCEEDRACRPGHRCEGSVCKVQEARSCSAAGSICESSTTCIGSLSGERMCSRRASVGSQCGGAAPFFFPDCEAGLACTSSICTIPQGGRCDTLGSLCAPRTFCQGTRFFSLCWPGRKEGQACGSIAFLRCLPTLTCVRNSCTRGSVDLGDPCDEEGLRLCKNANVCAGPVGAKICVEGGRQFFPCGMDDLSVCREGFRCVAGRCRGY